MNDKINATLVAIVTVVAQAQSSVKFWLRFVMGRVMVERWEHAVALVHCDVVEVKFCYGAVSLDGDVAL